MVSWAKQLGCGCGCVPLPVRDFEDDHILDMVILHSYREIHTHRVTKKTGTLREWSLDGGGKPKPQT